MKKRFPIRTGIGLDPGSRGRDIGQGAWGFPGLIWLAAIIRARAWFVPLLLLTLAGGTGPLVHAADPPSLRGSSVALRGDGSVSFEFATVPGDPRILQIQVTRSLAPNPAWVVSTNAVLTALAPGRFQAALPLAGGDSPSFYRVAASPPPLAGLRMSEVMSDNRGAFPDAGKEYWDWIEIHNATDVAINLLGYALTDEVLQPRKWLFPEILLGPESYLVVYASGLDRRVPGAELHTNFKLRAAGETLVLSAPDGSVAQYLELPALGIDESYGLDPAGDSRWVVYAKSLTTPGEANSPTSSGPPLPPPVFPEGGQFLSAGDTLWLTLQSSATSSEIRLTTNGNPVTADSPRYTGPVALAQTVMVRAKAFLDGRSSEEAIRTYFFGVAHDLPVVSLAAPQSNFEFRNGYLFGMGAKVLSPEGEVLQSYPFSGSNAWRDREIEVAIEFFEADHEARFRQRAGMAVFGGWGSRGYPQKSVALFARQQYGKGKFDHRIFPDRDADQYESFVLRNSGNDNQSTHQTAPRAPITAFGETYAYGSYFVNGNFTLLRDAMEQRLLEGTGLDTQAGRQAVVYLNGEYWGIYGIREKVAENYVLANHGFKKGEVDLIEDYGTVMAGDGTAYAAMRNFIAKKDLQAPANYATVASQYLDIDNFIDYHLAVLYFQNFDIGNIKCWRPRVGGGRFRWIVYDQDYGFNLWPPDVYLPAMARDYADYDNMFKFYTASKGTGNGWPNEGGRTLLLRRMLLNDTFKQRFIQRCADLLNTQFQEDRVVEIIHSMAADIRSEIPRHLQRWSWTELQKRGYGPPYKPEYSPFIQATWETNIGVLVDFARQRPAKLRQDCANYFHLQNGLARVIAEVVPAGAGRIQINTASIRDFPWSGVFFRDYPVTLAAVPRPGYRFVSWSGPGGTTPEPRTEMSLPDPTNTFSARFEAVPPSLPDHPAIVITEFQYHPDSKEDSGDWIELHNPGESPVSTTGWILRDEQADSEYVLPESSLAPGAYLVLCQDLLRFRRLHPAVTNSLGNFPFGLDNAGDTIRLYEATGAPVLELNYDDAPPWPVEADGTGHTLQLIDVRAFSTQPAVWRKSPGVKGTPGQANPSVFP